MAGREGQVERTRGRLLDALATLLRELPFDEISVGRICTTAGVSRQSFYRLFNHRDRLLGAYFAMVFDEFESRARHGDAFRALFETLSDHREELHGFTRPALRSLLFESLWDYQRRLVDYASEGRPDAPDQVHAEFVVKFQAGGVAALVMEWIDSGMATPAARVADLVAEVAAAFEGQREFLPNLLATHQSDPAVPGS